MGFFSSIFRGRDAPTDRTSGSAYSFFMGGSTSAKRVNERTAMQMTAVYSCVRILSEAVAGLPLQFYRYTKDGGKEKAVNHPLYFLLHDEPNPEMTSFVFRETLMTHLLLWGNAYSQIIRNARGEIIALYPLMPDRMTVNRDVVLGVTVEGYKDILSITVGANETSKFWLGMLNDLKNRGVKDVLFFCVDGLPGFKDAIQAVYPQAEIQRCVIHMLRNSFKYVNYNDLKKFSSDFKAVYNAPNETAALSELENIKEKWGKKYPYAISNWENNWEDVSSFFQFSNDIRRIMYTTNIIEGLNRQYRKVTKTKSVFPSDTALEKMLYLASENVTRKWTQRYQNWDQVLNQMIVLYGERLTNYL